MRIAQANNDARIGLPPVCLVTYDRRTGPSQAASQGAAGRGAPAPIRQRRARGGKCGANEASASGTF